MRVRMVVTDVAAMETGVCIAGYTSEDARAVRPVLPLGGGIPWAYLQDAAGVLVEPLSEIEIDLGDRIPLPPHTEDHLILGTGAIRILGPLPEDVCRDLLGRLAVDRVEGIFGAEIIERRYVRPETGAASLGTLRVNRVTFLNLDIDERYARDRFTLEFFDGTRSRYSLRVTDLAFREFCRRTWLRYGDRRDLAAITVRERLNRTEEIYVRIGLSRPFTPREGAEARCYLIVTGVYTFPTYLEGRSADYYPDPADDAPNALREESPVYPST